MNAREAIQTSLTSTKEMLGWYLGDLSDADLLVRDADCTFFTKAERLCSLSCFHIEDLDRSIGRCSCESFGIARP